MGADSWAGIDVDVTVRLEARPLELRLRSVSRTIAIVGPSGAGKSTLLRILAGLERRAAGRVCVDGELWQSHEAGVLVPPWLRRVGWLPQEILLFPHLTVRENLSFAGASPQEVDEIATGLQVTDLLDRRPRFLSGGERQRVALGRAMLAHPRLLLLDEPFSALDRPLRATLTTRVGRWAAERDVPLMVVSHDAEDAAILAAERWHLGEGLLRRD